MVKRFAGLFVVLAAMTISNTSIAAPKEETATITVTTVAEPPEEAGIDHSALRDATEAAAREVDTKELRHSIGVSLALISASNAPTTTCIVNLAVHNKKGVILGTVTGTAQASATAKGDQRERIARLALSNAMNRVPDVVVAAQ